MQRCRLLTLRALLALLIGAAGLLVWSEWRLPTLFAIPLNIRLPQQPEARHWLQQFFEEQYRGTPTRLRRRQQGPALRAGCPASNESAGPRTRSNLVLGVVGDGWTPGWVSEPQDANFDLAVVYYGSKPNFTCGSCSDVFTMHGPKWYILANLTESPAWQRLRLRGYEYIMLPDDDLQLDTCDITTFFDVLKQYAVLLAQPSVCQEEGSYTAWPDLYQLPRYRLHYTNFVEIMSPAFRFDFFQSVVRHTLRGTYTGYGLDFVWPALIGWPKNKVAVVDEVCMAHPPSPPGGKPDGIYQVTSTLTKMTVGDEQQWNLDRYNVKKLVLWRHGLPWNQTMVFGGVLRPGEQQQQSLPQPEAARTGWQHSLLPRPLLLLALFVAPAALAAFAWQAWSSGSCCARLQAALSPYRKYWRTGSARTATATWLPLTGPLPNGATLGASASSRSLSGLGSRVASALRLDTIAQD